MSRVDEDATKSLSRGMNGVVREAAKAARELNHIKVILVVWTVVQVVAVVFYALKGANARGLY